jgi:histidinol-phosphate aminotransferase
LAGLRLGYLMARPRICAVVAAVKLPFSVGIMQPAAALEMLDDPGPIRRTVGQIVREREKLRRRLNRIPGAKVIPSRTNFLLFRIAGRSAAGIFSGLKKGGVLVRSFDAPALRDWLRVTVGRPGENEIFLKTLKSLREEK